MRLIRPALLTLSVLLLSLVGAASAQAYDLTLMPGSGTSTDVNFNNAVIQATSDDAIVYENDIASVFVAEDGVVFDASMGGHGDIFLGAGAFDSATFTNSGSFVNFYAGPGGTVQVPPMDVDSVYVEAAFAELEGTYTVNQALLLAQSVVTGDTTLIASGSGFEFREEVTASALGVDLTIDGEVSFAGDVGTGTPFENVDMYGTTTLAGNVTITTLGHLTLNTVTSANADRDLTLTSSGSIALNGSVGATIDGDSCCYPVRNLHVTADELTLPDYYSATPRLRVETTGTQVYDTSILLPSNETAYVASPYGSTGDITFNGPIDGPAAGPSGGTFFARTNGTVRVNAPVGGSHPFSGFNPDGNGDGGFAIYSAPVTVIQQNGHTNTVDLTSPLMTGFTALIGSGGPYFLGPVALGSDSTPLVLTMGETNPADRSIFRPMAGMTGSRPITLEGPGGIRLSDTPVAYTGTITANSGSVIANTDARTTNVVLDGGLLTTEESNNGRVGNVSIADNGQISPGSFAAGSPQLYVIAANAFDLTPDVSGDFQVDVSAGGSDQLLAHGAVNLTGTTLELEADASTPPGAYLTIVQKLSAGPITGTFDGLDEGDTVSSNGMDFTISYVGGSGSNDVILTLPKLTSVATLDPTVASPATYGDEIEFDFELTPDEAGGSIDADVELYIDDVLVPSQTASITDAEPTATFTAALDAGTYKIEARYLGSATHDPETATIAAYVIDKGATTTSLARSASSGPFGSSVSFLATVSDPDAVGTVDFFDGATLLATETLVDGTTTLTTSTLAVTEHDITAVYSGDVNHEPSTSNSASYTVTRASSTTSLLASASTLTVGQNVTFTATLTPLDATGSVEFRDEATVLGTVPISSASAAFTTSALAVGTHSITAHFLGSTNYAPSSSGDETFTVVKQATTTALQASGGGTPGTAATLVATVTPSGSTGSVTFKDGGTDLGTSPVAGGIATLTTSTLAIGTHTLTATYNGDANSTASTSGTASLTVAKRTTATTLVLAPSSLVQGAAATFTATVSPASSGAVEFYDGTTLLGTSSQAAGSATFSTSALAVGTHTIKAVSLGTDTDLGSSSIVSTLIVTRAIVVLPNITRPATLTTGQISRQGVVQRLACTRACTVTIRLTISAAKAKSLGLLPTSSMAKVFVVGRVVSRRSSKATFTTTVKLTARAAAKIRAATKVVGVRQTTTTKTNVGSKSSARTITVRPGA